MSKWKNLHYVDFHGSRYYLVYNPLRFWAEQNIIVGMNGMNSYIYDPHKAWKEAVDACGKAMLELIPELYKTPLWFWAE